MLTKIVWNFLPSLLVVHGQVSGCDNVRSVSNQDKVEFTQSKFCDSNSPETCANLHSAENWLKNRAQINSGEILFFDKTTGLRNKKLSADYFHFIPTCDIDEIEYSGLLPHGLPKCSCPEIIENKKPDNVSNIGNNSDPKRGLIAQRDCDSSSTVHLGCN